MRLSSLFHTDGTRGVLIRKNILAGFVIKGWSALTILLTVPLTLNCLGVYQNGIWLTISSLLVWIDMFDVGLGNGLRNQLTIDLTEENLERARQTVSSTFAMLAMVVTVFLAAILACIYGTDVYQLLNADPLEVDQLPTILAVGFTFVCTTFVLKLIGNVYMSHQLPAVSNLLMALGQTVALLGTFLLYCSGEATLFGVVLVNTAAPFLVHLIAYPYTFYVRYPQLRPTWKAVNMTVAKRMMNLGLRFFALQIASVVLFMSSNLIISHLYSPELVNPYQIAYRYFSLILILFTVVCVPFWNATTEAYTRHDLPWISRANHRLRLVTLGMIAALGLMVLASPWIYQLWVGDDVIVPLPLSLAMGLYIAILISSMRYSYFLNGIGALRLQLCTAIFAAVIFLPLAWFTAMRTEGLTWFVLVLCAVNLPGLIINRIQFNRIIAGKASGLWSR